MGTPAWVDSKLIIWAVTIGAAGVMAYGRLEALGDSVDRVQTTLDDAQEGLSEHVQSQDAHTSRGIRVSELETDQAKVEQKIEQIDVRQQRMERNQARMCQAWEVDCE